MTRGFVSLAIPCFDGERTLGRALEAVAALEPGPHEVLVVDDGSSDASAAIALEAGVRVVRHERNSGLAAARNTALREARGEIIVFLDADGAPDRGSLLPLLEGLEEPEAAGCGGREAGAGEGATAFDRWRLAFRPQSHGEAPLDDVWMLPGIWCAYRREALEQVGGFDEYYRTNGEDVDVGIRLRAAGWQLAYRPDATVTHLRRDGFASLAGLCWRYGRWGAVALRRNGLGATHLLRGQPAWMAVSVASSLKRHRSIMLAAASPALGLAGLAGTLAGLMMPVATSARAGP